MRNNHFKRLYIVLAIVLLLATSVCALVACDKHGGKISVIFHINDGTTTSQTILMKADEMPYTPTRAGYTFEGWTLDPEGTQPYQQLTDKIRLYAQWTAIQYTVNFYVGSTLISTSSVLYGEEATPPTFEEYSGLLEEDDVVESWDGGDYTFVAQNLVLQAVVVKANSHATFRDSKDSGAKIIATYYGLNGTSIPSPAAPEKRGYDFLCWKSESGTDYSSADTFDGDSTYYAYWTPTTPTVPSVSGTTITYGETLTLTSANATNYSGISYTYEWLQENTVLASGKTLSVPNLGAGNYTYTLRLTATTNINGDTQSSSNSKEVSVTVNKATLTASAPDLHLTFGDSLPSTFDVTYDNSGFKYGDTRDVIGRVTVANSTYSAGSDVGRHYAVLGFSAANYDVKNDKGEGVSFDIFVQKKAVTVAEDFSKTYDGNLASKTFAVTEGLIEGHILYFTATTHSANVGRYVYQSYDYPNGMNISKVSIVDGYSHPSNPSRYVTANYSITYRVSAQINLGEIEYTLPAAVNYDGLAHEAGVTVGTSFCLVMYSTDGKNFADIVPTFTNIGEYDVYVRILASNYDMVYTQYTFVINSGETVTPPTHTKPVLTVHLNGAHEITYGDAMPTYTIASVDGLTGGDTYDSAVQGTLSISCAYAQSPAAGEFALTISGLTSDKYEIITEDTLTVNKATLTLRAAEHRSITFSSRIPTDLTYSVEGFKYADTSALLYGIAVETTYTQGAPVTQDGYEIFVNLRGLVLKNYDVTTFPSTLTVTKATPVIEVEKDVVELDYTGSVQSFAGEFNPVSTIVDDNMRISMNIADGKDGGIYEVVISSSETQNLLPATRTVIVKIKAAKIGRVYYTVEDALEVGGNILLIGNAFLSHPVVIKRGTTLTLPYREDGTLSGFSSRDYESSNRYINPLTESLLYMLTAKSGIYVSVFGRLAIGGEIGQNGGAFEGHTTGMHSVLVLEQGSSIQVKDGGVVDCKGGFILGDGAVNVESGGTLKHNYVVRDFGGGANTVGCYQKGGISPFNIFDMPNVQVGQLIYSGATVVAYCDLYVSGEHYTTEVDIVATSGALLNLANGASITVKHNGAIGTAEPRLSVSTYGNITIGSIKLSVKLISTVTVDMADVLSPLSYIIDLHIYGSLTTSNAFKLLPGTHVTVEHGGSLIIQKNDKKNKGVIVYSGDWHDDLNLTDGTPITGSSPELFTRYPFGKGDAVLLVKGTLTVESGAAIAGLILGENGGQVILQSDVTLSITSKEGVAGKGDGALGALSQIWYETASIEKTAQLKAADGTLTNVQAGTSYEYADGSWSAN